MTAPAPHIQRLQAEHSETTDRLQKLAAFIESEKFLTLSDVDQKLLLRQRLIMVDYVAVSAERLQCALA